MTKKQCNYRIKGDVDEEFRRVCDSLLLQKGATLEALMVSFIKKAKPISEVKK